MPTTTYTATLNGTTHTFESGRKKVGAVVILTETAESIANGIASMERRIANGDDSDWNREYLANLRDLKPGNQQVCSIHGTIGAASKGGIKAAGAYSNGAILTPVAVVAA